MKHKNGIAIAAALLLAALTGYGKEKLPEATYSNLHIRYNKTTSEIELIFNGTLSITGINYSLTISPRLIKDGREAPLGGLAKLPSQEMEGDWYKLSRLRKQRAGAWESRYNRPERILPTSNYTYTASIPAREWVDNVSVIVYTTLRTYSGITGESIFRFNERLTFIPEVERQNPLARTPVTTRPFVERIDDSNREIVSGKADIRSVENYIETHGEGALTVYFEVGTSTINPAFLWNSRTLDELIMAVNELKRNNNDPRVVIVGYSSPEGPADINQRLSVERSVSLQDYITSNTRLRSAEIATYGGGINWIGLKRLVAADNTLPDKQAILTILAMPVWNSKTQTGRLTALMKLNDGAPYRFLMQNYFPQLRGAAFIKVFYNKSN
ncbi:MAG: hypothetical protein LBH04_09535 [Tannerellaceae bacterium]|jgi:outer membrane protein OmpA-like peptidoglycan-associated protein|nr:hypothetical protein [Tannerellaceae bacterium]